MTADLLAHQYTIRRLTDKFVRRARLLAGRPDNSPWILDARRPRRTARVDFLVALGYLSPNTRLLRFFHEAMSSHGLSMLLVNKHNVERVSRQIQSGWVRPHVLLDLCSWPGDPFDRLLETADRSGVHTLRKWDHTRWILKSYSHPILEKAGLPVPPAVIFHMTDPDRDLTPDELARVGQRCVIKPSLSGASRGVVANVYPSRDAIAKAREFDRDNDWLVQKMVTWTRFGPRPAYLRAYNVCGHRALLWWCQEKGRDGYDLLSWDDLHRYDLLPAVRLIDRLAEITGMDYFSSEVAVTADSGPDRFVLIDYINDECDVDPDAHPEFSPPAPFSRWVCHQMADFVWRRKHNHPPSPQRGLFLHDGSPGDA